MLSRYAPVPALAALALLAACGDDPSSPSHADADGADTSDTADADAGTDAADASLDTDGSTDAGPDVATDAGTDTLADTAGDAQADAGGAPGTCGAPLTIDTTAAPPWVVDGDTSDAPSMLRGSCSDEDAPEVVYAFTSPVDGRWRFELSGPDPVIYLRDDCLDDGTERACNDDASDATLDAAVTATLSAGERVLIVADTYDFEEVGPVTLTISPWDPPPVPFDDGLWASRGYSFAVVVQSGLFVVADVGELSCIPSISGPVEELSGLIAEFEAPDEDTIRARLAGGFGVVTFDRVDELPAGCASGVFTPTSDDPGWVRDPSFIVDVAWHAMARDYAFFELRGLDWDALGDVAREAVGDDTTDAELTQILVDMLAPTHDGHVSLTTPNLAFEAKELEAVVRLRASFDAQDEVDDFATYVDVMFGAWRDTIATYLEEVLAEDEGRWMAGTLPGSIGYVAIFDFSYEEGALAVLADELVALLGDVEGLVIDVRINSGGNDTASLELAARFAEARHLAFTKRARDGEGLTQAVEVYVEPAEATLVVPTWVLVSESTVSAGEIFVMAMGELPHVTLVGQATSGEHSDILVRTLPNGWQLGLSNERYTAADGALYEGIGLPADDALAFDMLDPADIAAGVDRTLDYLLPILAAR